MKKPILILVACCLLVLSSGCQKWGDYVHDSENFGYKVYFPVGWVVNDQSSTENELLIATNPNVQNAKIEITARKVSPDFEASSYWPQFQRIQKEDEDRVEFQILKRGSVSCANSEGRYMEIQYLGDVATMYVYRAAFVVAKPGKRVILNINAEFPKDEYIPNEPQLKGLISNLEVLK